MRIYKFPELRVIYVPDALVYHCVPLERTTLEFIKKQALGTGKSERLRVKSGGVIETWKRYAAEIVKWGGSIVLYFIYLLKGQVAKGKMIVRFRYWVSKGLFLRK